MMFLNSVIAATFFCCMLVVRGETDLDALDLVELSSLPYGYDSLEPYIDGQTVHIHHEKHHAKYVANTKSLIQNTPLQQASLTQIVRSCVGSDGEVTNVGLFNNAAQSYNHAFYWQSMRSSGGGGSVPDNEEYAALNALITSSFGSHEAFTSKFSEAGLTVFGSGWVWLVWTPSGLEIMKTSNADTPISKRYAKGADSEGDGDENYFMPLLTMDVWEHAYYLRYQNVRAFYVEAFMRHLINWEFVNGRLATAMTMNKRPETKKEAGEL